MEAVAPRRLPPLLAVAALALLAGCAGAPPPPPAPEPAFEPVLRSEGVDWDATIAPSNCVQGPVLYMCGSFVTFAGSGEPWYVHEAPGLDGLDLAGGNLTLSWEAATPTTNALKMTLHIVEGSCPDCEVNRTLASQAGESPVVLEVPARALDGDQHVSVRIQPLPLTGNNRVTLAQDVHLEGTLVFAPRPPAPADPAPGSGRTPTRGA